MFYAACIHKIYRKREQSRKTHTTIYTVCFFFFILFIFILFFRFIWRVLARNGKTENYLKIKGKNNIRVSVCVLFFYISVALFSARLKTHKIQLCWVGLVVLLGGYHSEMITTIYLSFCRLNFGFSFVACLVVVVTWARWMEINWRKWKISYSICHLNGVFFRFNPHFFYI